MADKITVAEAINLANQNTKDLTNEQLTQMNEAFAESFFNKEPRSAEAQIASDVTIAEIDSRLEALAQNQNLYDEKDLDGIIAMAESVGMFSQKADVAKAVLEKAQKQKADMAAAPQNIEVVEDKENQAQATQQAEPQTAENQDTTSSAAAPETKEDEGTLTQEDQQAIEVIENTPEDQAELDTFDKESGIDKVTQEQLDANDKIMDKMPHPLALDENGNLVNKEFADEITALNNLTITDDKGNDLSEEEQNSARSDLIYAAQLEAETYARATGNGNEADVQKLYNEHFKEALQRNIVSATFATDFKKGMSKEQISEKFAQAVNNPQKASRSAVMAVAANGSAGATKIKDRIKAKFKSIPAVQKMEAKINAFDAAMTEKYGKKYQTAKRLAKAAFKSVKNVAVYSAIGAMSGPAAPIAMAALAAKSAYDSTKALQAEAQKNNMSFWQYAKANKAKVALAFTMSGLTLAGSALGLGAGGQELASKVKPILKTATRVLAVGGKAAPALANTVKAGWKKFIKKDNEGAKADWDKAKEGWARTAEAAVGIVVGSAITEGMSGSEAKASEASTHNAAPNENVTPNSQVVFNENDTINWDKSMSADWQAGVEHPNPTQVDVSQMTPEEMSQTLNHMGLSPDSIAHMDPQTMQNYINAHPQDLAAAQEVMEDKNNNGISDVYETDQSRDWTTANETQLDRLMDADPAKVNALLNDGEWHSSSDLKEMMENGQFNDEQLKAIHGLASREFDENGHIIDADLKAYYENAAKEEALSHDSATEQKTLNVQAENQDNVMGQSPVEHQAETAQMAGTAQMTAEDKRAYEAILSIVQKGENMADPEVRASVEGVAMGHLHEIKEAIAHGDNDALINKVLSLHEQGEHQEVNIATQENDNDSRKLANAKEDLREAQEKLDAAKAAYEQDPSNQKLEERVEKLEKEMTKEALDLEQRKIKENISDLQGQIKQDEHAYDNRDKMYETIEKTTGLSEQQVNQGLAAMGIDINNIPEDRSGLSAEAQDLLNVHDRYEKAHQNEEGLQARIQKNEQEKAGWEQYGQMSEADEKALKQGQNLSAESEERLPGQSQIKNSELLHSVQGMINPNSAVQTTSENSQVEEGRKVSELRGTRPSTSRIEVRQTTVNTQTITQTKGRGMG